MNILFHLYISARWSWKKDSVEFSMQLFIITDIRKSLLLHGAGFSSFKWFLNLRALKIKSKSMLGLKNFACKSKL